MLQTYRHHRAHDAAVRAAAAGEDRLGEDVGPREAPQQARGHVGPAHHRQLRVHVQGRAVVHLKSQHHKLRVNSRRIHM